MNANKRNVRPFAPAITLCAAMAALLLTGCGPREPAGAVPYTLDDAQALLDTGLFSQDMGKVDDPYMISMLYHVEEDSIEECVSYQATNTGESADQVAVIVFRDGESAASAQAGFRQRIEEQIESLTDYAPGAIPNLEAAVIRVSGNTALLAVGDADRISEAVDNLH